MPGDTTPIDTGTVGIPCSPDTVYFQNEILPLLVSHCTQPGCHNSVDAQDGVILDSYANILGTVEGVTNNNWEENDLMEVLVLNDPAEKMPPAPNTALTLEEINKIAKWIAQGAKNNQCNEQYGTCDTTQITYTNTIKGVIQAKCFGCHSGSAPQGGVNLSNYANVKAVAFNNNKLVSSVTRTANWMPKNGQKLDNCTIDKIKAWINDGAPE